MLFTFSSSKNNYTHLQVYTHTHTHTHTHTDDLLLIMHTFGQWGVLIMHDLSKYQQNASKGHRGVCVVQLYQVALKDTHSHCTVQERPYMIYTFMSIESFKKSMYICLYIL